MSEDLPAVISLDRDMTVQELTAQSLKINRVLESVMQEDVHYGMIPGTPKKTLYQAGAEKICSTFRLAPRYEVDDLSEPHNNLYRYRAKCSLVTIRDGLFVGSAMGEASTMEEKYQWEAAVCKEHWEQTDPTRRRIKFKKDKDSENGFQQIYQVQRNCSDLANTALKIACKRAFVSAVKGATAASDLLDVDLDEEAVQDLKKSEAKEIPKLKKKASPAPKLPFGRSKGKAINDPSVPAEDLEWMFKYVSENVGSEKRKNYERQDREFMKHLMEELAVRRSVPQQNTQLSWQDQVKLWQERHEAQYDEVCLAMKITSAVDLQQDKQDEFYERMTNLLTA